MTAVLGLSERLRAVFALEPSAPALQFRGQWHTWQRLGDIGARVALLLPDSGSRLVFGLIARNRPGIIAAFVRALSAEGTAILFNPSAPDAMLAEDLVRTRPPVVVADRDDWQREGVRSAAAEIGSRGLSLDPESLDVKLVAGLPGRAGSHFEPRPDAAVVTTTSGSTGRPKRVSISYRNLESTIDNTRAHVSGSRASAEIRLRSGVAPLMVPLIHTSAIMTVAWNFSEGRRIAMLERFEPWAWAHLIEEHKIAASGLVPAAIRMVIDAGIPREKLSSLRAVRAGSAPLDPVLAEEFERIYGIPVLTAYGATEFGGVASLTLEDRQRYGDSKRGTVGRLHRGVEARAVHPESGEELPAGHVGALTFRTEQAVEHPGQWIRTNDLGRIDTDGFLFIEGRLDDVINRGGFKVDLQRIEVALREHPDVIEAAAVGIPDARLGEVPAAAVVRKHAATVDADELRAWLRDRLLAYEMPTEIRFVDEVPRGPMLKVAKGQLLDLFERRPSGS